MPETKTYTVVNVHIQWHKPNHGKEGLYLFVDLKDPNGRPITKRQLLYESFHNPVELSDLITAVIMGDFIRPKDLLVDQNITVDIPEYSDKEILEQMPEEDLPAIQFRVSDLDIDPDKKSP
jgi:hypothetical protein